MKELIRKILLVVCAGVFVYSAYQLTSICFEYKNIENETENLIDEFVEESVINDAVNNEDKEEKPKLNPLDRVIKFDELLKKNRDVVGWIYIPDTNIDEPLMKGENNDSYLRKNMDKKKSSAGLIFVDENNEGDLLDSNTIIHGHNMRNGSRFHDLRYFVKTDYYKSHPYIYIYLPNGTVNVYEIFASNKVSAYSDLYDNNVTYASYVKAVQKIASQKTDISEDKSPLIMLSTCYDRNSTDRYTLHARLKENVRVN